MHTQFLIFPPTNPPFPIADRQEKVPPPPAPTKPRKVRHPARARGFGAPDLAAIFAGFRVAQVYVGQGAQGRP